MTAPLAKGSDLGAMVAEVLALDVSEYLSNTTDAILRCRLYGHAWDPVEEPWAFTIEGSGAEQTYTQRVCCMRCETFGVDHFDPVTLDRVNTRTYSYVDGYLLKDHKGALSRREVRQWVAARQNNNGVRRRRRRTA